MLKGNFFFFFLLKDIYFTLSVYLNILFFYELYFRKIHENHSISDKVSGLWSRNINQSSFSRAVIQPLKFNKKAPKPENEIIADNITSQFPSKFHKGSIATLNSTGNVIISNIPIIKFIVNMF